MSYTNGVIGMGTPQDLRTLMMELDMHTSVVLPVADGISIEIETPILADDISDEQILDIEDTNDDTHLRQVTMK